MPEPGNRRCYCRSKTGQLDSEVNFHSGCRGFVIYFGLAIYLAREGFRKRKVLKCSSVFCCRL